MCRTSILYDVHNVILCVYSVYSVCICIVRCHVCTDQQYGIHLLILMYIYNTYLCCTIGMYRHVGDCVREIVRQNGFRSFYKGLSMSVVGELRMYAVCTHIAHTCNLSIHTY